MHEEVIHKVIDFAVETGFSTLGLTYSPIKGPEGNIEYLAWLRKDGGESVTPDISALVAESHEFHRKEES